MNLTMLTLYPLYIEWLGLKPTLNGKTRTDFVRWILEAHPEFIPEHRSAPAAFRLACQEIQRGGRMPVKGGIGDATLRRHAPTLTRHYLNLPESERGTFQEFLNGILARCKTERALKRFLGTAPVPASR